MRTQQRSFVRAAAALQHGFAQAATATSSCHSNAIKALPVCAIGSASFFSSDAGAESIAVGDRVYLQMHGTLSNGEKFGATEADKPLSFIVGSGDVIVGIEEAVVGLRKGVTKSIEIAPEKAFGVDKDIHTVPRSQLNLRFVPLSLCTHLLETLSPHTCTWLTCALTH